MAVDIIARGMAGTAQETADTARKIVVPAYDSTSTYNSNDIVFYDDKLYICVGTNVTGTFDPTKWQQIVLGDEITEIINKLDTMQYPLIIKGTVATVADLANIQNPQPGWIYFVGTTSDPEYEEYVYTLDNSWEYIGTAAVAIDDHLDGTSTNPVENRIITNWLAPTYVSGTTYYKNDVVYTRYGTNDYGFFRAKKDNPTGAPSPSSSNWERVTSFGALIAKNFSEEVGKQTNSNGEIFNDYTNNSAGAFSHAEGIQTSASGNGGAHAEGNATLASGDSSHAEGLNTIAAGTCSHASGLGTTASTANQTVVGKYNILDTNGDFAFIVGNGSGDNSRSNAFTVEWRGQAHTPAIEVTGSLVIGNGQTRDGGITLNGSAINQVDTTPTQNNYNNIVTSAGVYSAIHGLVVISANGDITVDGQLVRKVLTQEEYDLLDPPDEKVDYKIVESTT